MLVDPKGLGWDKYIVCPPYSDKFRDKYSDKYMDKYRDKYRVCPSYCEGGQKFWQKQGWIDEMVCTFVPHIFKTI